jgi:hypothetical protein
MKTIWKFPLEITDRQIVDMPHECAPLTVQMQFGQLYLWAIVDPEKSTTGHPIIIAGTGNPLSEEVDGFTYIGSFHERRFVWHVFVGIS